MSIITAQVSIEPASGIPADIATNTLHFYGLVKEDDTVALATAIADFYIDIQGIYSTATATTGHSIKFYDTEGAAPNYPYTTSTFDFTLAPSQPPLPSEVAVCLSLAGKKEAGLPQARRRGRIYMGPLMEDVNSGGRPSTSAKTALLDAGETLAATVNDIPAIGTGFWGVWSPTNSDIVAIKTLSVDDAFDTQRRRGVASTSKTSVTLPLPT